MIKKNNNGIFQIEELLLPGLIHGFSTRDFGNLSYRYGEKEVTDSNRLRFSKALGINKSNVAQAGLIHGTNIAIVKKGSPLNSNILIEDVDALITNKPGVALWILTGDCAPIIFYDRINKILALAHSGWVGTVGKIALKTFTKMVVDFGSKPDDIVIGFGPTIEKCHYQKNSEIVTPYRNPEWRDFLTDKNNQVSIDLNGFTVKQLMDVGIKRDNINYFQFCTWDHTSDFFSQQAEKMHLQEPGRFATAVQMK